MIFAFLLLLHFFLENSRTTKKFFFCLPPMHSCLQVCFHLLINIFYCHFSLLKKKGATHDLLFFLRISFIMAKLYVFQGWLDYWGHPHNVVDGNASGTIHILRKHFFGERAQQKL